ncbi:uncharacterized, partial [Tachysurus ichikawai]
MGKGPGVKPPWLLSTFCSSTSKCKAPYRVNQLQHQSTGGEGATKRRCTVDWDAASKPRTRRHRRGGELWMMEK